MIDEMTVESLSRRVICAVHGLSHLLDTESAIVSDRVHRTLEERTEDGSGGLAMCVRELGMGEDIGGVLVLVALMKLRLDVELVQCTAHEEGLRVHTRDGDVSARLETHLLEGGRQQIVEHMRREFAKARGVGHGELAGSAEATHRRRELLDVGQRESAGRDPTHTSHQPDHSRVLGRPIHQRHQLAHRHRLREPMQKVGHRVRDVVLGHDLELIQVQLEHCVGAHTSQESFELRERPQR
mmetsp:Transcript_40453/g.101812  ORF Transcript_40453/g.101812 Transcript_40453/m.101812 type:complete len:240 (+) Transcript_40453:1171-1890(+)